MGATNSSLQGIKQNPNLIKLASKATVSVDDNTFWNELFAFSFGNSVKSSEVTKAIEDAAATLLDNFLQNNSISCNLGALVKVYVDRAEQLRALEPTDARYKIVLLQTVNALFILRCCLKNLVRTLSEENVVQQFVHTTDKAGSLEPGVIVLEQLVNALIETLVDVQQDSTTYVLHVETIMTLLVLLSVQMYSARPVQRSIIYKIVMQNNCTIHALLLVKCLINNFIKQEPAPSNESGSIIIGLASSMWSVLTLGYGKPTEDPTQCAILARLSVLLLLVLTNHCIDDANPYREAVFTACDTQADPVQGDQKMTGFKTDFRRLYDSLCATQNEDQSTLLLYLLLHRNPSFRAFVLSRHSEYELLLIPVLKILYNCPERSSHHVYMALIILLILTEDALFNEAVHDVLLKNITWYQDKPLNEITLGGLIILVVIRAIQYNISRMRDKFLHTNLLATLANMSNHFKQLSPYVCQKMVSLFKKLSKRFQKLLAQMNQSNEQHQQNGNASLDQSDARSEADSDVVSVYSPDLVNDLSIYEEVLRMILEIINSCLASKLTRNPDFVYTLLYNKNLFEPFNSHPSFQDIVLNIEAVLTYFSNKIDIENKDGDISVPQVYQIIQQASLQWPSDSLKKFPELKFRYVEDDSPEEFFIPYVHTLVYRTSTIYFNPQNIILFNPSRNVV